MQRTLESVNEEEKDDEDGVNVYTDDRELVLSKYTTLKDVLSYFLNTQFFESVLYKEIIEGFYVIMRYHDVVNSFPSIDVQRLIELIYVQLFYNDIYEGFDQYKFSGHYSTGVSDLQSIITLYNKFQFCLIECFACKTPCLLERKSVDRVIYNQHVQYPPIRYCVHTNQYYCTKCRTFKQCKSCNQIMLNTSMVTNSKCSDCLHDKINIIARCNVHYHEDPYKKVYRCNKCSRYACRYDTFASKPYYMCRKCVNRSIRSFKCLDNETFIRFHLFHCNNLNRVYPGGIPNERLDGISYTQFMDQFKDQMTWLGTLQELIIK